MNPIKRVLSYPGASAALKAERAKMAALHEEALAADRYRDLARSRVYTTADYEADKWRARQGPDGARGPDGVTGVTGPTGPTAPMRVIDYHLKPDPLPLSEEVLEAARASFWSNASVSPSLFGVTNAGPAPEFYVDQGQNPGIKTSR